MAVPSTIQKYFQNLAGLDLRSSDLVRSPQAATSILNADFRDTGALNKRIGQQYIMRGDLGSGDIIESGIFKWEDVNSTTGSIEERLIACGQDLFEKLTDTITLTYTGSGNANYRNRYNPVTGVFEFVLIVDGTVVSTQDLGDGTESGDMSISSLVTNLNAVTDFTCTGGSNTANEKAAFIPTVVDATVSSGGTSITVHYWSKIDTPSGLTTPFSGHYAQRTNTSYENPSFAQLNGVTYISNGYDELSKFDGNRIYRAGLPQAQIGSVTEDGCGSTFGTGEKYSYRLVYEYTDARENLITGQLSAPKEVTVSGASVDLVVPLYNIKESAGTISNIGFNLDQAQINGGQSGVTTITVDSGHDLKVDDYVYINDGVSGEVVRRKITATTATTVTISGDAVNVTDNEFISVCKLSLYRTIDYSSSGVPGLYYLVTEVPNDSTSDSQSITDSTSDTSLQTNLQLIEPIKAHGLPPKAKYMTSWRSQLVLSGDIENTTTTYYSDIINPEYFPEADNSFTVNRPVTGLYARDNFLYVFEQESVNAVNGDFGTDNFTVSPVSTERVGAIAHATITEVMGRVFFLSREGVFSISESEGLRDESDAINPRFGASSSYAYKQAVAFNWRQNDKYLLFLPKLTQTGSNPISASDATSEIYAYDYFRNAWLQWDNFNFMGGAAILDNELYMLRKETSGSSTPYSETSRILNTGTEYDFADHTEAITFNYSSHWEDLGEPSVWKKFLRIKVHSLDSSLQSFEGDSFVLTVTAQHNYDPNEDVGSISMDFSGGAEGWGIGEWGLVPWGEARLIGAKNKLASKKVRSHRCTFSNDVVHENILISGYSLEIVTPYRPAIKE